ncbi:replication-associated polyprotein [Fusarium graminearum deltaflexivirus 1]|uniref:Replication-associated polyprotein n=1 Tax=Fusarium graminearum deltaflexivirus 1 TaxID=1872710 RepID=A0A1B1JH67_9VIRU|nr:replication-associated polyprotein [Fusarium graminearum deltaflexivirus 1]ANS13830.1 replication-associated polyprotein [Fusarium graminearum deltaflexivirus 1]
MLPPKPPRAPSGLSPDALVSAVNWLFRVGVGLTGLLLMPLCSALFLTISLLYIGHFLFVQLWCNEPPPFFGGACWTSLFVRSFGSTPSPGGTLREQHRWLDRDNLVSLYGDVLRHEPHLLTRRTPFIRIVTVAPGLHHTVPHRCAVGKVYHYTHLPAGFYGADLDPGFFDDSALKTTALSLHMRHYNLAMSAAHRASPYAVPKHMHSFLIDAGIDLPVPHAPAHAHPVHYAFENRSLSTVIPMLKGKWYALFLKTPKVNYLTSGGATPPVGTFNPRYEGKDISRYAGTDVPSEKRPTSDAPVWFMHDTLHHLSPTTVGSWFDRNPKLQYLVATCVIPPETYWDLPTLRPKLYTYTVDKDVLTYIPEGDQAGHYIQPYSARRWLGTSSIITPRNHCVHVALVSSNCAHHVFVLSRPEVIPQRTRVLDMAPVTMIPWMVHPLGSLFDRITSPNLLTTLVNYATRVSATNQRDLYAKVASHQAEVYGHFPQSYVRAAVLYAMWVRLLDYHASLGWWSFLTMNLTRLTRLPLVPFAWTWQSYTSRISQGRLDVPHVWQVTTETWVSSRFDSVLPGIKSPVCPADLQVFQLPARASRLSRYTRESAAVAVWLLTKFIGFIVWDVIKWVWPRLLPILRVVTHFLDINFSHTSYGLALTLVFVWFGLRGPTVHFPDFVPHAVRFGKWSLAALYFLPYARFPFRTGVSYGYVTAVNYLLLTLAFPRLHLTVIVAEWRTYQRLGSFSAEWVPQAPLPLDEWSGWWLRRTSQFIAVCVVLLSLYIETHQSLYWGRAAYEPLHGGTHTDVEQGFAPYQNADSDTTGSEPSSPSHSRPASPLLSVAALETPTDPSDAPSPPASPLLSAAAPSRPATPPSRAATPQQLPPVFGAADPLAIYNVPPADFDNFRFWQDIMQRLAVPPNVLDVGTMCVWDCLSATLGVDARILWANYCSSLPVQARAPFTTGLVPAEGLVDVLNHFNLPYTVRTAEGNNVCPRGPGGAPPPARYDPATPPLYQRQGARAWPDLNCYLQRNGDGTFHLALRATPDRGVQPVPHRALDVIGWPSKLVPHFEVCEVANFPKLVFAQVYRRLSGTMRNPLSPFLPGGRIGPNFFLPAVPVQEEVVDYTLTARDAEDACALATDMKTHPTVLQLHDYSGYHTSRALDTMAKELRRGLAGGYGGPTGRVRFHLFHGAYGTGKTFALAGALQRVHQRTPFTPGTLAFHTWDHDLREPLKNSIMNAFPDVGLQTSNFLTGCMPLAQPRTGTLVLDDAGKLMAGFLPLLIATNPGLTDIYVTFDATQAIGVFPNSPSISRKVTPTTRWLSAMSDYYATQVVRTAPAVTELYGMPVAPPVPGRVVNRGQVIVVSQSPADVPLLAVSPRFTQTQNMGGQQADTFTECQGHTIHGDVCIDLGGLTATATDAAAWTALTRATGNIYLKMGPAMNTPAQVEACWAKSQILSALLTVASVHRTPFLTAQVDVDGLVRSACLSHLSRCISPAAAQRLGLPAPDPVVGVRPGVSAAFRTSWLNSPRRSDVYTARTHRAAAGGPVAAPSAAFSRHSATPVDTVASDVPHIVRHFTTLANDSVLTATPTNYSLPAPTPLTAAPDPVDDINEPTDDALREVTLPNWNSTFQHITDGAPDALHHTRADKLTDELGKQKRIRVGQDSSKWSRADERRLQQLKKGFRKFFDVQSWNDTPFNEYLMDFCNRHSLTSWASKRTKRTIAASVAKQTLDAPFNFVKLFPKGQYIKKKPKWRSHAFPSQTVSDFNLGRIFRDSAYAVYLETCILKWAYPSTYLHCRASPDDVSKWYKEHWQPGPMIGNDYTAWDSGVDKVFLEFDLWLMSLCHFPTPYIEKLRFERLNTYSHLGTHMPRQESGDRWTWILNTARNAALTGASLDFPPRTPACFSGDDGVVLGTWRRTTGFSPDDWLMKPKMERGSRLEFCGLIFGNTDITFDDTVVHWRARFGLQQGRNDADYWRSIRDAIVETSSKLGGDSSKLASASLNLSRAVAWFDLPSDLLLPHSLPTPNDAPLPPSLDPLYPLKWLLFLR